MLHPTSIGNLVAWINLTTRTGCVLWAKPILAYLPVRLKEKIMNRGVWPALSIVVISLLLIGINEFTEWSFIRDYALVFIIAGMFLGLWLGRWNAARESHDKSLN